jgi:hypothetical protein
MPVGSLQKSGPEPTQIPIRQESHANPPAAIRAESHDGLNCNTNAHYEHQAFAYAPKNKVAIAVTSWLFVATALSTAGCGRPNKSVPVNPSLIGEQDKAALNPKYQKILSDNGIPKGIVNQIPTMQVEAINRGDTLVFVSSNGNTILFYKEQSSNTKVEETWLFDCSGQSYILPNDFKNVEEALMQKMPPSSGIESTYVFDSFVELVPSATGSTYVQAGSSKEANTKGAASIASSPSAINVNPKSPKTTQPPKRTEAEDILTAIEVFFGASTVIGTITYLISLLGRPRAQKRDIEVTNAKNKT